MSCLKLKSVVLFLKILVNLVLSPNFGGIIHDIAQKLHIKRNKAQLDINFLSNCKNSGVFPKFIVHLLNVDKKDMYEIKKKLRNNAIHKQIRERNMENMELQIKHNVNNFTIF